MTRFLGVFAFVVLQLLGAHSSHAQFNAFIPPKYKDQILFAPVSKYPETARTRYSMMAQGVYRLTINPKTGEVDEVGVLKHANGPKLDATVIMDFFKWKFKPGAFKQIDIPVVFDREIRVELKNAATR